MGNPGRGLTHFSTGRLTPAQAAVVERWRARLLLDVPLPGVGCVGPAARLLGFSDRPRCAASDVIAVATLALLAAPPPLLEVARWDLACQAARPQLQPVSYYLTGEDGERMRELRWAVPQAVAGARAECEAQAARRSPAGDEAQREAARLIRMRRVPPGARVPPRGALARLAIERWAGRPTDEVCLDALAYAQDAHENPRRARRDMREIARRR